MIGITAGNNSQIKINILVSPSHDLPNIAWDHLFIYLFESKHVYYEKIIVFVYYVIFHLMTRHMITIHEFMFIYV